MVLNYTTLVPSLGLCIVPDCEAGLSTGMQREPVPPHRRKKERSQSSLVETSGGDIVETTYLMGLWPGTGAINAMLPNSLKLPARTDSGRQPRL